MCIQSAVFNIKFTNFNFKILIIKYIYNNKKTSNKKIANEKGNYIKFKRENQKRLIANKKVMRLLVRNHY